MQHFPLKKQTQIFEQRVPTYFLPTFLDLPQNYTCDDRILCWFEFHQNSVTKKNIYHLLIEIQIPYLVKVYTSTGFFLKAMLWPDFTELFFRFSGVKTGDFYLTSAKKAIGFWCQKSDF